MKSLELKHRINRNALRLTAFSACFGILLVILFALTKSKILLGIGFYHLFPTVLIHVFTLGWIIVNTIMHKEDLGEHFLTIFLVLLNIPLAFACAEIVFNII